MSVVEQARSIIGRFSPRHRNANTDTYMQNRQTSSSLVGRVEFGLVSNSRPDYDAQTEAVGTTFGRFYNEKIANLNPGTLQSSSEEMIALKNRSPK